MTHLFEVDWENLIFPSKYPTSQTEPFSPLASRQRTPQRALQRAHPQPHQHQQLKRSNETYAFGRTFFFISKLT
jgi:hypothetical protein